MSVPPLSHAGALPESPDDAMLALHLVGDLGPTRIRRGLDRLGDPVALCAASADELASAAQLSPRMAERAHRELAEACAGRRWEIERQRADAVGARIVTWDDPGYPTLLKLTHDPPAVLYVRGELTHDDTRSLGIVGSRKCSAYGRDQADRFAAYAATVGLTVVSGGARGIDGAAHRAAGRAGGRTIAVLGCGVDVAYPPEHAELFDAIAASGRGAVISECPMGSEPLRQNFPRRNRIISGLSLGVLVVEAGLRSGALITARVAAEDHQREVMAVPGRVDTPHAAGCHRMIREGWAALVTAGADVLAQLGDAGRDLDPAAPIPAGSEARDAAPLFPSDAAAAEPRGGAASTSGLTERQSAILAALDAARSLDELVDRLDVDPGPLRADLTMLEIRGLVRRDADAFRRR